MRRRAVILLVGLVLISDAVIIALAAANRAGAPECVLTLTERELALPPFRDEDSTGLSLSFALAAPPWFSVNRVANRRGVAWKPYQYDWLDDAKLAALGFRTAWEAADATAMERYATRAVRPAFLALELDGVAFARLLAAREREVADARAAGAGTDRLADLEALLALDRAMCSRLVPVDAGGDPRELRARHPDRSRYCIVPGLVRLDVERRAGGRPRIRGRAVPLIDEIDVPLRLRSRLVPYLPKDTAEQAWEKVRHEDARPPWPAPAPPRYTVTLPFGRHYEPWIVDIAPLTTDH
jgi:hypothetical protein